jgi:hypothetical protein
MCFPSPIYTPSTAQGRIVSTSYRERKGAPDRHPLREPLAVTRGPQIRGERFAPVTLAMGQLRLRTRGRKNAKPRHVPAQVFQRVRRFRAADPSWWKCDACQESLKLARGCMPLATTEVGHKRAELNTNVFC